MAVSDELQRLEMLKSILTVNLSTPYRPILSSVNELDDAALIQISEKECLVVTSDFVRGPHFYLAELGYLTASDLGYYLVAANLSDLAAMGARPIGVTTIVRYEKTVTDDYFRELFAGIKLAADIHDVHIIGGDIGEYKSTVLSATALGLVKVGDALTRRGTGPHDLLCVTGTVGLPITALLYFKDWKAKGFQLDPHEEDILLNSWRRPPARLQIGSYLAENHLATACQDISDGLKATVEQMSQASGRTFTVEASKIPIADATKKLAAFIGCDPIGIGVSASVDFELLFTASQDQLDTINEHIGRFGVTISVIGWVNQDGKNLLRDPSGADSILPGTVWKQQTTDYLKEIATGEKHG